VDLVQFQRWALPRPVLDVTYRPEPVESVPIYAFPGLLLAGQMGLQRLSFLAAAIVAACTIVPAADAAGARPPVVWLKGEGNFTKSHRHPESIDKIVIHVTEGAFWGSVRWLQSPRAHASSHYVVARDGKIVQLVHLSDIAWHAGNWKVNSHSVGIEHEGFTYGSGGFTNAQYHASARLAAWIARRSLLPIDRAHIIGHAEVPSPGDGRGGSSHHTDPGPHWKWDYYLRLVRRYAGFQKLSVTPLVPAGPLRGIVPWRARVTGGISTVEFSINGRVVWTDRHAPFAVSGGLNTARLGNGTYVLQVYGVAGPGRYDIARRTIVVDNKAFALTSAGARPWTKVRGPVKLRVRPWGAKAAAMTFPGRRPPARRRPATAVSLFLERCPREAGQARAAGRRHLGRRARREAADPARHREACCRETEAARRHHAEDPAPDRGGGAAGHRPRALARRGRRQADAGRVPRRRRPSRHRRRCALHLRLGLDRGAAGNAQPHRPGRRSEDGRGDGHGDGAGIPRERR
jgi:hypothetical protein